MLVDAGGPGGFGAYLGEMLGADGVIGLARVDPATDSVAALSNAAGIVVYGGALTIPWIDALDQAARRGAGIVAVRAGPALLARFGVQDHGVLPALGVRLADGTDPSPLRLHVEGRRWTAGRDSRVMASFAGTADGADAPAALHIAHGSGRVTAWAFDVARNVACIRQGNPEWTGSNRDAFPPQQLIDAMIGWITPAMLARPDADLYQQALTSALAGGTRAAGPHPVLDYFPSGARSVLVATSDAHAVGAATLEGVLRRVEDAGGRLSIYYGPNQPAGWRGSAWRMRRAVAQWPVVGALAANDNAAPTADRVAAWRARGHEFAPHPDIDDESIAFDARFERAWQVFADEGYGVRHLSTRTHRILWSGWAKTAQAQRRLGVRMNLDAYNYGPALRSADGRWAHGHLIGSGLPLRFTSEDGTLVDCYQQPTQIVDEAMVREFGGPEDLSAEQAVEVAVALIADATAANPAALCGQFHADGFVGDPARVRAAEVLLDGTLAACRQAGVPILTAAAWLAFLDGRRATALTERTWNPDSGRLSGTVAVAENTAPGATLLLPADVDGAALEQVTIDDASAAGETLARGGREWVRCAVRPGTVPLVAQYRRA